MGKGELFVNGVDKTEEANAFSDAIGLSAATSGRHSRLFLAELFFRATIFGDINPFMVLDEIRYLEGRGNATGTKGPSMFKRSVLSGLWHKHHLQIGISSMAQNLENAMRTHGIPVLETMLKEAEASGEERYLTEMDIRKITDDAVNGNYKRRSDSGRLTGEWIVYAKYNDENYYLCLATHKTGDDRIRQKIEGVCVPEYPFLGKLLISSWP